MPDDYAEQVSIRQARSGDLAAMLEIERAAFPDPWSEASLAEELSSDLPPLVVEQGGVVRGYLCLLSGPGERHLTNIAVHHDARRRGLGKRLLEAAIHSAREDGCRHLFLEVRPSNAPARQLYSGLGFVELYRRRGYYIKPSEDGLVLVLALEGGESAAGSS
jgi:ribosomal-protein-alanine N-acetyltransferase